MKTFRTMLFVAIFTLYACFAVWSVGKFFEAYYTEDQRK